MEKPISTHLFCFVSLCSLLLLVSPSHQQPYLAEDEVEALSALWNAWGLQQPNCDHAGLDDYGDCINGLGYIRLVDLCHWPGQWPFCLSVQYLDLSGASLNGNIPDHIGRFPHLKYFRNLSRNNLSGPIPQAIGQLTNLLVLDLSFNSLSGQIPSFFQKMKTLEILLLGSNNIKGTLGNLSTSLKALDVSFNPLNVLSMHSQQKLSMNYLGTFVDQTQITDGMHGKTLELLECVRNRSCINQNLIYNRTSFAINCGGNDRNSSSLLHYYGDVAEINGTAFFYVEPEHQWIISNIGSDIPGSIIRTNVPIYGTLDPLLFEAAMMSPKSLRYFFLGLKNGIYSVDLHFAEISNMTNLVRLFDVYVQGERVLTDFNILNEAKGPYKALVKSCSATVNASLMEIHFLTAAKWACCAPTTLGPLISAINLSLVEEVQTQVFPVNQTPSIPSFTSPIPSNHSEAFRKRGRISGIVLLCTAVTFIASSVVYLWWIRDKTTGHIRILTESPRS